MANFATNSLRSDNNLRGYCKKLQLQTGKRVSAQAVGGAVGHNPISVIVPCHRVMGAKGNLTGYAGGLELKIALLKLEGVNTDELHMPKKPFDK